MIYSAIRTDQTHSGFLCLRVLACVIQLSMVIRMMEENIEELTSPSLLAKDVKMSTRQLERLFRRYLNRSPKRYYMELRLQKARNLLMQTDMSVINVACLRICVTVPFFQMVALMAKNTHRERGSHTAGAKTCKARLQRTAVSNLSDGFFVRKFLERSGAAQFDT